MTLRPIFTNVLLTTFMCVVTAQWAAAIMILQREEQSKGKEI